MRFCREIRTTKTMNKTKTSAFAEAPEKSRVLEHPASILHHRRAFQWRRR